MPKGNELVVVENKKKRFIIIPIVSICVFLLMFSTIFSFININSNKIVKGVSINGVDIQGLTIDEAKEKLNSMYNMEGKQIILKNNQYSLELNLNDIETKVKTNEAIEEAYNIGRNNNIFVDNYTALYTRINKKDIDLDVTFNIEKFSKLVNEINSNIPNKVEEVSFSIEEEELIIKNGKKGFSVKEEELRQSIINAILNSKEEISIELEEKIPNSINIENIYESVHREPKDAYLDNVKREIIFHQNGISFNIENAKELLLEEKEEYRIPLDITEANITVYDLPKEAFPDLLARYKTPIMSSNHDRTYNLNLSAELVDGTVIVPGEVFSYNKIWEAIPESEWRMAPIYTSEGVVPGSAGGICQLSTTIYNAALYANMEIVMRDNHMYMVAYEDIGKDAMVADGDVDFRFRNSRSMPIKVMSRLENGEVIVEIFGVKEDMDKYEIEIYSYQTSTIYYQTVYKNDSSLVPGTQVIEQYGDNGGTSVTYKRTKLNGEIISEELISEDYYTPLNQVVRRH